MLPVDVRTRQGDARAAEMLVCDDLAQTLEAVVPLARITKTGDAIYQLPNSQLRIPLDMEVEVDQARHHDASGEIDHVCVRRQRSRAGGFDSCDAIPIDRHAHVVARCAANTVDQADVIEDDRADGLSGVRSER